MLMPSTATNVTNSQLILDVALCIQSLRRSEHYVPYDKFCERFERNIGYSLKEHLEACQYSFAAVIKQVLRTTRTKCRYDANQKMIILKSEEFISLMNNHSTVFFPYGDSRLTESSLLTSPTESSLANEQNLQRTSTESQSVVDGDMPLNTNTSESLSFHSFGNDGLPEENCANTSLSSDALQPLSNYHSFVSDGSSEEDCEDCFFSCFGDAEQSREEQLSSISPRQPNSDDLSEEACGDLSFCCSGEITRTPQASENVNESAESAASCDFNNLSETLHGRRFNCSQRDSMREKSTQRDPCENCNVSSVLHEVQESSRSCSLSVEEEKISSRRTRIEMKNECMRLWSDKVQNLPKLLCFLQMCHRINGPLLINNCEKVLEDLINYDTKPSEWSLEEHGPNMDVKRLFELKMFRSLPAPNRMKVQPVDCILMSQFHLLPKGLTTEIYKIVLKTKRERNLEEVIAIMLPFSRKKDELSRRRDIIESILRVPDVMSIDGDYVKLRNDDEFFVVTGVINSNNSVAS